MASSLYGTFALLTSSDRLGVDSSFVSLFGLVYSISSSSSGIRSDVKSSSSVIQPISAKEAISIWDNGFPSNSFSVSSSFLLRVSWKIKKDQTIFIINYAPKVHL